MSSENEQTSSGTINQPLSVTGMEPRKFSKYNPNLSRRSTQPTYKNQAEYERKSGYISSGQGGGNGLPSKYQYTTNVDARHPDGRLLINNGIN